MRRRFVAIFLILTLVICSLSISFADEAERKSGLFSYRLKGNGNAVITGFDWESNEKNDVYIPRQIDGYTVSEIGPYAFSSESIPVDTKHNTSDYVGEEVVVILPDTIVIIGEKAFFCTSITACAIPSSVELIGSGAFAGCPNLLQHSVNSENKVYATIDGVLYNKVKKELVSVPIIKATTYSIPDGIISVGEYALYEASLSAPVGSTREFVFPESLKEIAAYAFMNTKPVSGNSIRYDFNRVETIGDYAFANAKGSIMSWGTLHHVGEHAFDSFYHKDYFPPPFPAELETIGSYSFYNFGEATGITSRSFENIREIDLSQTQISIIPDHAFANLQYDKFEHYNKNWESPILLLPTSLREIGDSAFEGLTNKNTHLQSLSIIIPKSVEKIGKRAFADANQIEIAFETDSVLKEMDNEAFKGDVFTCKSIDVPQNVKSIGDRALFCNIESVSIPESATYLGTDIIDRSVTKLRVIPGSYAALYASENGIPTDSDDDTSWLNN